VLQVAGREGDAGALEDGYKWRKIWERAVAGAKGGPGEEAGAAGGGGGGGGEEEEEGRVGVGVGVGMGVEEGEREEEGEGEWGSSGEENILPVQQGRVHSEAYSGGVPWALPHLQGLETQPLVQAQQRGRAGGVGSTELRVTYEGEHSHAPPLWHGSFILPMGPRSCTRGSSSRPRRAPTIPLRP